MPWGARAMVHQNRQPGSRARQELASIDPKNLISFKLPPWDLKPLPSFQVLDVMNTLGVSNSLIKVIERRQTMDLVWMFVGMVVTIVVLAVTWIYFRRK
jgi:Golgi SNAP receptor complex protein 2